MKIIENQLYKLEKQEQKLLRKNRGLLQRNLGSALDKIKGRIPNSLEQKIHTLFEKAFYSVFEKGTPIIEKTYRKDEVKAKYIADNYIYDKLKSRRSLRSIQKPSKKIKKWGRRIAFIEGAGLGFLGIGLPDIPLFLGVLLKGIYEICLSYGFDYTLYEEKLYILKLIRIALVSGDEKRSLNKELDLFGDEIEMNSWQGSLEMEIRLTSASLSEELLAAKFIQGLPLIGVVGAIFNREIYKKVTDLAAIKYKKRYLHGKITKKTSLEVL